MNISQILDCHLGNHGNQSGLSNGNVGLIWLTYILSEGDHRKAHVIDWVNEHRLVLSACLGEVIDSHNFTDDRLTRFLFRCSQDQNWSDVENDLAT